MRYCLLISFHFPPVQASSGVQRTLKFATYLREFGWEALVLTIKPFAYAETNHGQLDEIPGGMIVRRALGLDSARHLSLFGRYPQFMALPDRYITWLPFAVSQGRSLIKKYRPEIILSTYPVVTAHLIGNSLARWSGIPWVADFRDTMYDDEYPEEGRIRISHKRIEQVVVNSCKKVVVTTPGSLKMYMQRYPNIPSAHWQVIPNGYDEGNFINAGILKEQSGIFNNSKLIWIHSGTLYPKERNPLHFFEAVSRLKRAGRVDANELEVRLRGSGHDKTYEDVINELDIADIVKLKPAISYIEALSEMMSSDGLLLFQSAGCNHQIPAKIYEYLRAGKNILAFTDRGGDTAKLLKGIDVGVVVPMNNVGGIINGIETLLKLNQENIIKNTKNVESYSRKVATKNLAFLFDNLVESREKPKKSASHE